MNASAEMSPAASPAPPAAPASARAALPHWAVPVVAFAAFGGLIGWRVGASPVSTVLGVAVGVAFAFAGAFALTLALALANPHLGRPAVREAAATGFLLILPFMILALAAEILLGWNASQVFSSAGLMTACGAVGVEVGRRGGGKLRSMLVPMVIAFLLSTAWVMLSGLAGAAWRR
jgi:hypothetical protein